MFVSFLGIVLKSKNLPAKSVGITLARTPQRLPLMASQAEFGTLRRWSAFATLFSLSGLPYLAKDRFLPNTNLTKL